MIFKTTALALCHCAGKHTCPVWYKLAHTGQIDIVLNETSKIIIRYLKWYRPLAIWTEAGAYKERLKSLTSELYPLYGLQPAPQRLKSRKRFLRLMEDFDKFKSRMDFWKATKDQCWMEPAEELASGHNENWEVWKSLNRCARV